MLNKKENSHVVREMNVRRPASTFEKEKVVERGPSMSSCMLIMDDNHWLVEWLAYHWTTLNLRHMIIAIDERSKTSPITILDRWKGRIDFELWNDSHFFEIPEDAENLQEINLARQTTFLPKCMHAFKERNASWVMFTDTDEFIVINKRTQRAKHKLYRESVPSLNQTGSILSFLEQEKKQHHTKCFSMGRLQFSPDFSPLEEVRRGVPSFLNASAFMTMRWLNAADDLVGPKNIVDLSSVPKSMLPKTTTHQHRVIKELCGEAGHTWTHKNSLLQVYHYMGTYEQFTFRDDARNNLKTAGRNNRFDRYKGKFIEKADDLRPWIQTFVNAVGEKEAARLLEGVGRTEGWPSAKAHQNRFADYNSLPIIGNDDDDESGSDDGEEDESEEGNDQADADDQAEDSSDEEGESDEVDEGDDFAPRDSKSTKDEKEKESSLLLVRMSDSHDENEGPIFYSEARKDRSGAVVGDMLLAHAYAFANKMKYGGACAKEPLLYLNQTMELIDAIGLNDTLMFECPKNESVPILDRQVYGAQKSDLYTPEYLSFIHSKIRYPPKKSEVVIHIRRGDVEPCGHYSNRYLPNSHYLAALQDFAPRAKSVSVFSESDAFESFDEFANYTVFLDTDLADAWREMMTADYVILSKSSFSLVPAILNRNATVIYTPFSQGKLPHWKTVSDSILERTQARVKELSRTCTE